jgi:hypothetical protein
MPKWLCNQLRGAFHKKDQKQIRLLNDCWFLYQSNERKKRQLDLIRKQTL